MVDPKGIGTLSDIVESLLDRVERFVDMVEEQKTRAEQQAHAINAQAAKIDALGHAQTKESGATATIREDSRTYTLNELRLLGVIG